MQDRWCQTLQSSQHIPSQDQLTGRSHSPHGFMVLFLGPGLISMSPHSNKMVDLSCSYRIIKNNGHQLDRHKYITQYTIT